MFYHQKKKPAIQNTIILLFYGRKITKVSSWEILKWLIGAEWLVMSFSFVAVVLPPSLPIFQSLRTLSSPPVTNMLPFESKTLVFYISSSFKSFKLKYLAIYISRETSLFFDISFGRVNFINNAKTSWIATEEISLKFVNRFKAKNYTFPFELRFSIKSSFVATSTTRSLSCEVALYTAFKKC